MIKRVLKYELSLTEPVSIPEFSTVVHAAVKDGKYYVWAEVQNEKYINEKFGLVIFGTGKILPEISTHIKTFIDGDYVWHVYSVLLP